MKKLLFFFILMLSPMLANAVENQQELLYGEWRLVGWYDGGIWFEVDTNYVSHRHMSIEIKDKEEGYTMAYSRVTLGLFSPKTSFLSLSLRCWTAETVMQ